MVADAEGALLLEQLLLGILVVGVVVLFLPFLLVMAGVGAAMLIWFAVSAAALGALVFWLVRFRSPAACAADRTSLRR